MVFADGVDDVFHVVDDHVGIARAASRTQEVLEKMTPTVPPVSAMARSCRSSRLRQCFFTPSTPVWVDSRGWLGSCAATASQNAVGWMWARSTKTLLLIELSNQLGTAGRQVLVAPDQVVRARCGAVHSCW